MQEDEDEDGSDNTGNQGGKGSTGSPHIKAKDKQGVAADVDTVHDDRNDHRDAGVAHCAEQCGSGVVQGNEWVGQCSQEKVDFGVLHNGRFDIMVDKA